MKKIKYIACVVTFMVLIFGFSLLEVNASCYSSCESDSCYTRIHNRRLPPKLQMGKPLPPRPLPLAPRPPVRQPLPPRGSITFR